MHRYRGQQVRHGEEQVRGLRVCVYAELATRQPGRPLSPRHVDKDEVLLYCASVGATHHLTSAKTGAGVSEAFTELMRSEEERTWPPPLGLYSSTSTPTPCAPGVASKKKPAPALGGGGCGGLRTAPAEGGAGAAARLKLAIVDDEPAKKEKKGGCC